MSRSRPWTKRWARANCDACCWNAGRGTETMMTSRRNMLRMTTGGAFVVALPGCEGPDRGPAVPTGGAHLASVLGLPNERFQAILGIDGLEQEFMAAASRQLARKGLKSVGDLDLQLLAVSGGGEDGAFGAGLLCGW